MGLLDGKVAIVTGAGGGIGRCHALLLAREGARVVVNDVGGARDGRGEDRSMADAVVEEIRAAGGEALANHDSVASFEGAGRIVQAAVDAYGRADILVNNAGILRDKTLLKMAPDMWEAVLAVHLTGTFACGQAFARHVKERADAGDRGGRIINTSSYAGLMGNYGQSNYAAAKAGIYGLTRVWALELAKLGVTVNCIAPMAKTRMTRDIAMVPEDMRPEQISPMVLFLASDLAAEVTGRVFGIHGQQLFAYEMIVTEGVTKEGNALWTAQEIAERLDAIVAKESAAPPPAPPAPAGDAEVIARAFARLPEVFLPERARGWTANILFDIRDGTPWTVSVDESGCRAQEGKHGQPTCVVTVDQATYAAIVRGEEKPEKAFLAGKIRASNLGDMMKFGAAFDMKKARALAEAEASAGGARPATTAPPPPAGDAEVIARAFSRLPEVFVPERAQGWTANILFDIRDGTPWTVTVDASGCRAREGKHGDPTCVVTVDQATYAAIVRGEEKPEKAFMAGKIRASNLGDMMKFGAAFDMKKARALAEAEASAGEGAPSARPSAEEVIDQAFALLPQVFVPERAPGWEAAIVFDIQGASPWTVRVSGGRCTTERGRAEDPTCVVTVDRDTYAAVIRGEEKPEKAFLAGKIRATNLADMMKFGAAFDMKKAREVAERHRTQGSTASTPAPSVASGGDPAAQVAAAFDALPGAFRPSAVPGWEATIRFEVRGAGEWTLVVDADGPRVTRGAAGEPTCVVTTALEDYARVVTGELKAEQAFMQRKITASNLGDMLNFGRAFDMRAVQEHLRGNAAASTAPPAARPEPSAPGGMNRACIGNTYSGEEPQFVRPEDARRFAEATLDDNPAYGGDGAGTLAPPLFAVRLLKDVVFRAVGDEELGADLLNLVHAEQDMRFLRPLRTWDLCATRATITDIEDKSSGQLLRLSESVLVDGEEAVRVAASMFVRAPNRGERPRERPPQEPPPEREIAFRETVTVPPDHGSRYAEASLDNNPIHTDEEVARLAGFPGIILQGLCTMAFAAKALVGRTANGDPARLRRLAVRFSKPVFLGDVLETRGWVLDPLPDGSSAYGFEVVNQAGEAVITDGRAEVAPA